ncbi:MAG: hypothetical protein QM786_16845 [Breznakibacter sp.]
MEKHFEIPIKLRNTIVGLLVLGIVLLVSGILASGADGHRLWANVLINGVFFVGLAGFAALLVAAHTLADSGWHVGIQRIPEAMGAFLPIGGVLMLLVLPGIHSVFHWSHPGDDPVLLGKTAWLNVPFFSVRTILFVAFWTLLFLLLQKRSDALVAGAGADAYRQFRNASAFFAVGFVFTFYMAVWDWLMSIDPHWYSTIYNFYVMGGMLVSAVAGVVLLLFALNKMNLFMHAGKPVYSDLGTYLFAFSVLWGYLWGAQYMLIWYSNIPEETVYYTQRLEQYPTLFYLVPVANFVVPAVGLISRRLRRKAHWLTFMALIVFAGQWLNVFLLVMPGVTGQPVAVGGIEIGLLLVYLSVFVFAFFRSLSNKSLVPQGHPFLKEAESH